MYLGISMWEMPMWTQWRGFVFCLSLPADRVCGSHIWAWPVLPSVQERWVSYLLLPPIPLFFPFTFYALISLGLSPSLSLFLPFFPHPPLSLPVSYKQSENHFSEVTAVTCLQYVQLPPLTVHQKDSMIEVCLCTMSGLCMCFHLIHPLTTWTFTFRWHNRFRCFNKTFLRTVTMLNVFATVYFLPSK